MLAFGLSPKNTGKNHVHPQAVFAVPCVVLSH
jgi:hypothetical protein